MGPMGKPQYGSATLKSLSHGERKAIKLSRRSLTVRAYMPGRLRVQRRRRNPVWWDLSPLIKEAFSKAKERSRCRIPREFACVVAMVAMILNVIILSSSMLETVLMTWRIDFDGHDCCCCHYHANYRDDDYYYHYHYHCDDNYYF